jgi:hypothetical protein
MMHNVGGTMMGTLAAEGSQGLAAPKPPTTRLLNRPSSNLTAGGSARPLTYRDDTLEPMVLPLARRRRPCGLG